MTKYILLFASIFTFSSVTFAHHHKRSHAKKGIFSACHGKKVKHRSHKRWSSKRGHKVTKDMALTDDWGFPLYY